MSFLIRLAIAGVLLYKIFTGSMIALIIFLSLIFIYLEFLRFILNKHNEHILDKIKGTGRKTNLTASLSKLEQDRLQNLRDKISKLKEKEAKIENQGN